MCVHITTDMKKMRYIFDTPKMPEIGIILEKKDQKLSKIRHNVSHQYGKKSISWFKRKEKDPSLGFHLVEDLVPLYQIVNDLKRNQLSKEAKIRLKWMDYYQKTKNVSLTCRHFGISRQLFYYWLKRYDPHNLATLENKDRAPKRRRQREITPEQEMRIVSLRKKYLRYGKEKLSLNLSTALSGEDIFLENSESDWKIQTLLSSQKEELKSKESKKEFKRGYLAFFSV